MYIPQQIRRQFGAQLSFAGAICTSVLLVAACSTDESPTAPSAPAAAPPSFEIDDGAHGVGYPGFYFLPLIVAKCSLPSKFPGTFDPCLASGTKCPTGLNPIVRICLGANCDANTAVAVFTIPVIKLDLTVPQYFVNWKTKGLALDTYRIHVLAGAAGFQRELGVADVKLTATTKEAKDATTSQQPSPASGRGGLPGLIR